MPAPSNAAWWIQKPSAEQKKRKQSVSASFSHDMAELFRNVAMHCYNKLVSSELSCTEKLIWLVVHTATMSGLLTVLSMIWTEFVAQYMVINLHNPLYPVESIPFPAISICSNNRFSHQAALKYAELLSSKDSDNHTAQYILRRLKYYSAFFYRENREFDFEELQDFQAFVDNYDIWENETLYDTRRVLDSLTPDCNQFVRFCTLAGVKIDCFGEKAFKRSLTMDGACCTFNADNSYKVRQFANRFVHPELGLTVVLNTSRVDFFAPILNFDGYIVFVHESEDFADNQSGESPEMVLNAGKESFLSIKATKIDTDKSLRSFSPKIRQCFFLGEVKGNYSNSYSFSNCITRCRMQSVIALCGCVPFYMPLHLAARQDLIYCSLAHLSCLFSFNFKWGNVLTKREFIPGLERALESALYCPECMPNCDDVQYRVSLMDLPIDPYYEGLNMEQWERIGLSKDEMSVLHVHFDEPFVRHYRRMVSNTWFEAMCAVGNVSSIFLGFSIVAFFEIMFIVTKYISIGIRASFEQNYKTSRKEKKSAEMQLYICP